MDKCTYFIQLLIVLGGLVFIDGQHLLGSGYGRRRIIPRRRFYPGSYPGVGDPYGPVRRRHYPRETILTDPYFDDAVRPAVVVGSDLISGRRPVVADTSSNSNQDTNVVNNNNNNNIRRDSNNVVVSQTTGRRRCTHACEDGGYMCPYPQQCLPDSTCEGRRCRSMELGGLGGIVGDGFGGIVGDGLGGIVGGGHLVRGHAGGGHFIH